VRQAGRGAFFHRPQNAAGNFNPRGHIIYGQADGFTFFPDCPAQFL
jgi:hypothetical protein